MLGPEDVDNLMENEGLHTDEIEKLRLFYNNRIKDKGLSTVLTTIEQAILENQRKDVAEVRTPRQGSRISTNFDIAQENYLKATRKMQVNQNSNSLNLIDRRAYHMPACVQPDRPISKASSVSPEITDRNSHLRQLHSLGSTSRFFNLNKESI